ncbi:hypothetical protein NLJ89_g3440 [Agrocybe chaxingu]|uniref:Uncharacterized protein n=1 Tax=Agrocybe chaxingu TaxID=84603 RepID=A0A9W8K5M2_9AGAR|nr:hypothetical protein NLJ89_g3440 [Agrocybe chaxingu]
MSTSPPQETQSSQDSSQSPQRRYAQIEPYTGKDTAKRISLPGGPTGGQGLNDVLFGTKIADGWTEFFHPNGKPYFYHRRRQIVTEMDMRNPKDTAKVELVHIALVETWNQLKLQQLELGNISHDGIEIFIGIESEPQYYFVKHTTQEVFWLTEIPLGEGFLGPTDTKEGASYDLLIRHQYYAHLAAYPCHNHVPEDGVQFLHGFLKYICADDLTTDFKVAPWDPPQAKILFSSLDSLINKGEDRTTNGFKTFFISQLLTGVAALHHGTLRAINSRPPFPPPEVPALHFLLGMLCFFANSTYESRMSTVFAGKVVSDAQWKGLVEMFMKEWSEINLLAALLLIADAFFLSSGGLLVVARTSSIVAAFFMLGSLVIGLHHVRKHQYSLQYTGREASEYVKNIASTPSTLRRSAIILSLPLSLLLWGLVALTCAVANLAFSPRKEIAAYVVPACTLAVVCTAGLRWRKA